MILLIKKILFLSLKICFFQYTLLIEIWYVVVAFLVPKGWLAIAKLKPLSLFISLLSMPKKAIDNVKIEKLKVKVVSALQ